jgi:hypothetical protein
MCGCGPKGVFWFVLFGLVLFGMLVSGCMSRLGMTGRVFGI